MLASYRDESWVKGSGDYWSMSQHAKGVVKAVQESGVRLNHNIIYTNLSQIKLYFVLSFIYFILFLNFISQQNELIKSILTYFKLNQNLKTVKGGQTEGPRTHIRAVSYTHLTLPTKRIV